MRPAGWVKDAAKYYVYSAFQHLFLFHRAAPAVFAGTARHLPPRPPATYSMQETDGSTHPDTCPKQKTGGTTHSFTRPKQKTDGVTNLNICPRRETDATAHPDIRPKRRTDDFAHPDTRPRRKNGGSAPLHPCRGRRSRHRSFLAPLGATLPNEAGRGPLAQQKALSHTTKGFCSCQEHRPLLAGRGRTR